MVSEPEGLDGKFGARSFLQVHGDASDNAEVSGSPTFGDSLH